MQNLIHAVNYTIKCDGSVNFGYVQAAEATYCTATTETPPVVSHFVAASPSVAIRQANRIASNVKVNAVVTERFIWIVLTLSFPLHLVYTFSTIQRGLVYHLWQAFQSV